MSIDAVLTAVRDIYIRAMEASMAAHQPCHVEPALRRADGALAVEGMLKTPYRVDLIGKTTGNHLTVDAPERAPDAPNECRVDGMGVRIHPFSWDAVRVVAQPVRKQDLLFLSRWFTEWFDPEDMRGPDELGLYRVVHYISDPELSGDTVTFVVDFGSAGIDAFKDLLKTLAGVGVVAVSIG